MVRDTPRQDILPPLVGGLVTPTPGAGTLFPQPRMATANGVGELMDERAGRGWRLVGDGTLPLDGVPGLTLVDLGRTPEAEGVVAAWMSRHGAHAAIVRPDHYTYGTAADAGSLSALIARWQAR